MAANEFRLLKAFIEVDTRGSRTTFRNLNLRLDRLERRIRALNTQGGLIRTGVSQRARRQIDTLLVKLREAQRLSRNIVILGGVGGAGAGAAGGAAARGLTGVGGGRVAQAATFGLLAGNARGQVSGAVQAGILGGATGGVALGAGLLAGVAGAIVVKRSADVAANFESIEVALQGIIRDEGRVSDLLQSLRDVSLDTSTNLFTDLLPSSVGLLGSGFTPEEIPPLLEQLADLSIITERNGLSFAALAEKVARNKTQFRLLTRDVREFTNAGINVLPSLQEQLGVTSNEDVFESIKKGKVTIDNLLQAITDLTSEGGIAFNLQANAADTFNFQLGKLRENVTFLGKEIGDKFLPSLTDSAKALNELFVERPEPAQAVSKEAIETVVERDREEARLIREQRRRQAEVAELESARQRQRQRLVFAEQFIPPFLRPVFGGLTDEVGPSFRERRLQFEIEQLQQQIQARRREIGIIPSGERIPSPRERDPFAEIEFGVEDTEAARRVVGRALKAITEVKPEDISDALPGSFAAVAAGALGLTLGGASGAVQLAGVGAQFDPGQLKQQGLEIAKGIAEGDITFFSAAEFAIFKELPLAAQVQSVASKGFEKAVTEFGKVVGALEKSRLAAESTELIIEVRRAGNL